MRLNHRQIHFTWIFYASKRTERGWQVACPEAALLQASLANNSLSGIFPVVSMFNIPVYRSNTLPLERFSTGTRMLLVPKHCFSSSEIRHSNFSNLFISPALICRRAVRMVCCRKPGSLTDHELNRFLITRPLLASTFLSASTACQKPTRSRPECLTYCFWPQTATGPSSTPVLGF